ncbi:MAG: hypothetical protein JO060_07805 [Candidatus Eremiobacteraeota bacterium]|nr:hypothetical protein [Candidatus Eremiobacteraeota bacterium]
MKFQRIASATACLIAGLFVLSAGVALQKAEAGTIRTTVVHVFHPTVPKGKTVSGNCWTTSIATNRKGAYRCMAGNAISDPCFATSTPDIVVCDADPAKNNPGFAMRVKGPLPAAVPLSGPVTPWLVQLRDGTTCSPLTGTRALVGKVVVGYDCAPVKKPPSGTYVGLADTLRSSAPLWKAQRLLYKAASSGAVLVSSSWVPIAAVWR